MVTLVMSVSVTVLHDAMVMWVVSVAQDVMVLVSHDHDVIVILTVICGYVSITECNVNEGDVSVSYRV